ncbi:hypothetical protein EDD18DRAFT_1100885 [Armillaria luteobubalina]|uniref:Uncharacterized protein n=1 Tax=Armillaria luteobubalina TaxID=153913 RepID=A0AA39QHG5_9AGAR|nr:hypothetical protein EDD18DRAFT_1100885 [Armillaria luteobubalina]
MSIKLFALPMTTKPRSKNSSNMKTTKQKPAIKVSRATSNVRQKLLELAPTKARHVVRKIILNIEEEASEDEAEDDGGGGRLSGLTDMHNLGAHPVDIQLIEAGVDPVSQGAIPDDVELVVEDKVELLVLVVCVQALEQNSQSGAGAGH